MKVLIIYASFGSGHQRAAEALVEAFQDRGIPVQCRDLLEFLPPPMSVFYSWAYHYMITSSRRLWRLTYDIVNAPKSPYRPATALTQSWQFTRLKNFLREGRFTHVLSTHFTPSALLTDWSGSDGILCETFSVITDHEAHRCWKRTGLHHYFVPSGKVASELRGIGVPETNITISGIPVSKLFSSAITREESRKQLNLPETAKVVLVLCSAVTTRKSLEMIEEFLSVADEDIVFLIVAGRDSKKEKKLRDTYKGDGRVHVFGFTKNINLLMRAANLIVTKPGGLIVSEALASGLPLILLEPIPGQEEANAKYAEEEGAALCCMSHKKGIYGDTLKRILSDPLKLVQMCEAARKAARPRSAFDVVETILSRFVVSS